jgi:hypothetical protein
LAIKPADNESFYREVDEELRRDRFADAWRRFKWLIVSGTLLLVAAIGGYIWWQNRSEAKAAEQGETLVAALDGMEKGGAQAAAPQVAQLEQSGTPGYRAAGLFSRANLLVEAGNLPGAIAVFQRIAADEDLPDAYRNAALVRQTALEFDRLQPREIVQRLRPMVRRGHPWFGSAGELTAFAHLREQRPDLAGRVFAALAADETVPQSIRSRAVQMAGALGIDAVQQSRETGAAQQAPAPAPPAPAAPAAPATKE